MAESSNRFVALDKPIEDYIQEKQNKTLWQKPDETLLSLLSEFLRQKEDTRKIEEFKPTVNSTSTCTN